MKSFKTQALITIFGGMAAYCTMSICICFDTVPFYNGWLSCMTYYIVSQLITDIRK